MTSRPTPRSLGAFAIALLVAGAALVAGASSAQAHDVLRSTDPTDGSTVAVAPDHVTLTFDQPAQALGTEIDVRDPAGTLVSVGDPSLTDTSVTQAVAAARPAGVYTVEWRVTSADGHPVSGTFTFTATGGTGVTGGTTAGPTTVAPFPTATPAATTDPGAWGDGDNHVRPALVGFLLLIVAVGVGVATWLVARQR